MFGFLRPTKPQAIYRMAYCQCCAHQRVHYGLPSLPFLTYESAFVYLLALDAAGLKGSLAHRHRLCFLSKPYEELEAIGHFASSLSILLTGIKLDDDVIDSQSKKAQLVNWFLRTKRKKAIDFFSMLDRDFSSNIASFIDEHHQMERMANPVAVVRYSEPVSQAYGYVFGLLSDLPGLTKHREVFSALGRKIGSATVAFDCASDWKKDKRKGMFNPVANSNDAVSSLIYSQVCLREAMQICSASWGETCPKKRVLVDVHNRVYKFGQSRWPKLAKSVEAMCLPIPQQRESTILYSYCICPCENGAIIADSDDCSNICIGCICCICLGLCCCMNR